MIRKVKGGFRVLSPKKGRNMGTYKSKAQAETRERQLKFFASLAAVVRGEKRAGWGARRTLSAQRSGKGKRK